MIRELRLILLDPDLLRVPDRQKGDNLERALLVEAGKIKLNRPTPMPDATPPSKSH